LSVTESVQLDRLFEERRPSRTERFVFFCSQCFCILKTSPEAKPPDAVIETLHGRCPSCSAQLRTSIACKAAPSVAEWEGTELAAPRNPRPASVFKTALSLRGFRFGFGPLDTLVQRLDPGWLVAFKGPYANVLAERLCVRAQLSERAGGLDSATIFIDGGNSSDPYLFSVFAKLYLINPDTALRRVATSRAFTVYQLANLVRHELPKAVKDYDSKLVIVSGVLEMFDDPSVTESEAKRVIQAVIGGLQVVKSEALVLVTLDKATKYDGMVTGAADVVVGLEPCLSGVRSSMTKHPFIKPSSAAFRPEDLLTPIHGMEESDRGLRA
jgi:Rad51 protein